MANQPCCTHDPDCHCIPFKNQGQGQSAWCWAAVSANIYNSLTSQKLKPCDVVRIYRHAKTDPCQHAYAGTYNETEDLGDVLDTMKIHDGLSLGVFHFNDIN